MSSIDRECVDALHQNNADRTAAAFLEIQHLKALASWYLSRADAAKSARERDSRFRVAELIGGKIEEVARRHRKGSPWGQGGSAA